MAGPSWGDNPRPPRGPDVRLGVDCELFVSPNPIPFPSLLFSRGTSPTGDSAARSFAASRVCACAAARPRPDSSLWKVPLCPVTRALSCVTITSPLSEGQMRLSVIL